LGGEKMNTHQSDLFVLKRHDIQLLKRKKTLIDKTAPFVALALLILGITRVMDYIHRNIAGNPGVRIY